MAKMLDSEGSAILTEDGRDLFDISMVHWNNEKTPELSIILPIVFKINGWKYEGSDDVYVSLKDVMEEYIDDILAVDGDDRDIQFAIYLEDYAKRLRDKVGI